MEAWRILLLSGGSPWPVTTGGYQRTNLLYQALAAHGAVDTLIVSRHVCLSENHLARLRDEYGFVGLVRPRAPHARFPWRLLRGVMAPRRIDLVAHALCGWTEDYGYDAAVGECVRRRLAANRYDLVVSRYLPPLVQTGRFPAPVAVIVDVDDFESEVLELRIGGQERRATKRWSMRRRLHKARGVESRLERLCDHCWVTKEFDLTRVGGMSASILPNIPFPSDDKREKPMRRDAGGRSIVFVGSMVHRENITGLDDFVSRCWPAVRRAVPGAVLRVVGTGLSEAMRTRWEAYEGVEVVGFAPSIARVYDRATFVVVPLFGGGGTKVKVLEALMHGRTCVVAEPSLRGYEGVLRHAESLWVAPDNQRLIEGCIMLLRRDDVRKRLARTGHQRVIHHYTFTRFARVVGTDVTRVLEESGPAAIRRSGGRR
jgi:glycosyltransferase involved in cell wall biosynthesis